ncbi:MAG: hypothetical protein FWF04_01705, partial [Clostridiales bacterium]|nr:hypothetical protein [Clostridiales bacterium]
TNPGKALPLTLNRLPGNEYLEANIEKFPEMWDFEQGQTKPYFSTSNNIFEEVWIEVPCDVDGDGKRDLIRAQFRRPRETEQGLKTPIIATVTPYAPAVGAPSYPFGGAVDIDGVINPDTTDLQYTADIRYDGPRYKDLLAKNFGDLSEWGIPTARVPLGSQKNGTGITAVSNPSIGGWHAYFIPLGYSCAGLAIIGSTYGEGFLTYGDYAENLCAAALVDWVNGRLPGYTSPTSLIKVEPPYWATGEVAMNGTSYEGTLPFAAAITGVEGLKTIIPVAPVTSSYEYYRANGAVYAPGGWQGEDVSMIIGYCFGRGWQASGNNPASPVYDTTPNLLERFYEYLWGAYLAQDRITGDYSKWWDGRNQVSFMEDIKELNPDLGIIAIHGYNDDNVKFKQTAMMFEMAQQLGITAKAIFHQGMHTSPYTHSGNGFYPQIHKWMDHYLYGVTNGMPDDFANVRVQSNVDISWLESDTWPLGVYQNFYPSGDGRVGALAGTAQTTPVELPFKDAFLLGLTRGNPAALQARAWDPFYTTEAAKYGGRAGVMASAQFYRWRNYMLGGGDATTSWTNNWTAPATGVNYNLTTPLNDRLLYVMDITEDMRISGTIKMTAKVKADKGVGSISAMLVDFGSERRYGSGTANSGETVVLPNGTSANLVNWSRDANATPARIISRGAVDVQNPNYDGKIWSDCFDTYFTPDYYFQTVEIEAGEFYPYTWEMDVMDYTVVAGHKLVLIIFSTDPEYTLRPFNPTEFTAEIGAGTYLSLPLVKPYTAPAAAVLELEEENVEAVATIIELEETIIEIIE